MSINYISIDIETTGLDHTIHEIVSVGAVYGEISLDERTNQWVGKEVTKFYSLIKPVFTNNIDKEAMVVNGLGRQELESAPDSHVVRADFIEWWEETLSGKKLTILGQNFGGFDKPMFTKWLGRFYNQMFDYHQADTWVVAKYLQDLGKLPKGLKLSLSSLAEHFGIERLAHSALADACTCLDAYVHLLNLRLKD